MENIRWRAGQRNWIKESVLKEKTSAGGSVHSVPRVPSKSPYVLSQKIKMTTWWFVESLLFKPSFNKMNWLRCSLLRCFGADIGKNTFIHNKARIWFPWNLKIGSNSGIGFDALIYNLDMVEIGDYVTISHQVHINTASHDYTDPEFPLMTRRIFIDSGAFVGADSYIAWGVNIGMMTVIGARSVVISNQPDFTVCFGHPCKPYKKFEMK